MNFEKNNCKKQFVTTRALIGRMIFSVKNTTSTIIFAYFTSLKAFLVRFLCMRRERTLWGIDKMEGVKSFVSKIYQLV